MIRMRSKKLDNNGKIKSYKRGENGYHFNFPKRVEFYDGNGPINAVSSRMLNRSISTDIQAELDHRRKMLIFNLNPSECQFTPSAFVKFYWHDVDCKNVKLFYINNEGEYILPTNTYIDLKKKTLTAKLKNFSRFAISTK
jgi:hypothetical protein